MITWTFRYAASILHREGQRAGCSANCQAKSATVKSILDSSFRYTNSVETDLRKTFARIRREQRTLQQSRQKIDAESLLKVRLLRQKAV